MFASVYDRLIAPSERAGLADRRRRLLAGARGRVLEVGGGTGLNLPHYHDVEEVIVLEPDAAMRRRMRDRLAAATVRVEMLDAALEDAPFPPGAFDTIVSTLVLCSVPDIAVALARVRELLSPRGRFLFLEHGAGTGARRRVQSAATPIWRRIAGGCRLNRDIAGSIRASGLVVSDLERFEMPAGNYLVGPAVSGVALLPSERAA